jgi:hypothetical protein
MTRKQAKNSIGSRVRYDAGVREHWGEVTKLFMGHEWIARVAFQEGLTLNCRIEDLTIVRTPALPGSDISPQG